MISKVFTYLKPAADERRFVGQDTPCRVYQKSVLDIRNRLLHIIRHQISRFWQCRMFSSLRSWTRIDRSGYISRRFIPVKRVVGYIRYTYPVAEKSEEKGETLLYDNDFVVYQRLSGSSLLFVGRPLQSPPDWSIWNYDVEYGVR